MPRKNEKKPDPTKDKIPVEEPGKSPDGMLLEEEEFEVDELDDYEMADMHAIRELVMLDPNDIEFRQRHAEDIEMAA